MSDELYKQIIILLNKNINAFSKNMSYSDNIKDEYYWRMVTIDFSDEEYLRLNIDKRYNSEDHMFQIHGFYGDLSYKLSLTELNELNYLFDKVSEIALQNLIYKLADLNNGH